MSDEVEKPRSDPEILPPDRSGPQSSRTDSAWIDGQATHRVYVTRIGPLGFGLLSLGIGLFAAAMVVFLMGFFLILIPVVGLLVAVAVITALMRGYFGRRG